MEQWAAVLIPILGVTTVIGTVLAALVYGGLRTLRSTNSDLRDRVGDLEKGREADRTTIAEQATHIAQQDTEIEALKSLVTGRVEWVAVSDLLEQHHTEANGHWSTTETYLDRIAAILEGKKP